MRLRNSLFWGIVLIVLAALLLLRQLQVISTGDVFGYFWPALVVLFGLWLVLGALTRGKRLVGEYKLSVPLESAKSGHIKLDHGAGRLTIRSGASSTELLNGAFGAEVDLTSRLDGDKLDVKLRNDPQIWAWIPGDSLDWEIALNREIPISLKIDSGASSSRYDLSDLKVSELNLDTGASTTEMTLPANAGETHVDIDTGASTLRMTIPTGVSARIRTKTGVATVNVDTNRFPRLDGGFYQSADYATATNRADITIDAGVGTIEIK